MKTFTKHLWSKLLLLLTGAVLLTGCEPFEDNTEQPPEGEDPKVISYTLTKALNSQLTGDVTGAISDAEGTITIIIDYAVSSTKFKPTVTLTQGATLSPAASQEIDGSLTTNKYTVTGNGKTKEYKVIFLINQPLSLLSLKVNGTKCWYNEGEGRDGKIYVPIHQSQWGKPCLIEAIGTGIDKVFIDGAEAAKGTKSVVLTFDKEHELKLTKGTATITKTIVASGLPIVHLEGTYNSPGDFPGVGSEKEDIEISVYDPTDEGKYLVEKLFAGISMRGATASSLPKKAYSLEIRDRITKEEKDTTLFGLRKDGDWILDAMGTDNICMRNRVATDIWNDLHKLGYAASEPKAVPATRGQMVEVYYNGKYHGLYCMTERVDRKQLNIDKANGYLYKAEGWDETITFAGYERNRLPQPGSERWENDGWNEGYQAEYPDPFVWTPLVDLVKFVCDSNDATLAAGIADRFDITNLADFFIFNNIMGASDNCAKNTYIGVYNYTSSIPASKRFFYAVWDLDGTFGRNWGMEKKSPGKGIVCFDNYYVDETNRLIKRLAKTNGGGFGDQVKSRWSELKGGVCSKESITARFKAYEKLLTESGAYKREQDAWSRQVDRENLSSEISYIDGWLGTHLSNFDTYIQNWDTNVKKL